MPCIPAHVIDMPETHVVPDMPIKTNKRVWLQVVRSWTLPAVQVVCTDVASNFVSLAAKRAQAEGVQNFRAEAADAQDLAGFADNSFAVVTCVYGLLYTPDYKKVMREAYRVLQQGGLFVVAEFGAPPQAEKLQVCIPHFVLSIQIRSEAGEGIMCFMGDCCTTKF